MKKHFFPRKNDKKNTKKGFSLLETVISLTIVTIVFGMAVSSMLFVSSTFKDADIKRFFLNESRNFLECYKIGGSAGFAENANEFFFTDSDGEEGWGSINRIANKTDVYNVIVVYESDYTKKIAYTVDGEYFNPSNYFDAGHYFLVINVNKSFKCTAYNFKGEVLFECGEFYSRYDI